MTTVLDFFRSYDGQLFSSKRKGAALVLGSLGGDSQLIHFIFLFKKFRLTFFICCILI